MIEDSPTGVQATLAAVVLVVAVSTPFTRQRLHDSHILDNCWIVDDLAALIDVVQQKFNSLR